MDLLKFKITKEQIYDIFDEIYPDLKKNTKAVSIKVKRLDDGNKALQLTVITNKSNKHKSTEEYEIQSGDEFQLRF